MDETFDSQLGFSGTVIYFSNGIWTKSWDSQIIGYSAAKSVICLMVAAFPYTLTSLSSTVFMKESVGKREDLLLRPEGWYNEDVKVAALKVD